MSKKAKVTAQHFFYLVVGFGETRESYRIAEFRMGFLHISNKLALAGTLSKDKAMLIARIREAKKIEALVFYLPG